MIGGERAARNRFHHCRTRWKTELPGGGKAAYGSPIKIEVGGVKQYVCFLNVGLVGVSAADGKRVWAANQFTDTGAASLEGEYFYWGVSVSPLVEGDLVIVQPGGVYGPGDHSEIGTQLDQLRGGTCRDRHGIAAFLH